MRGEMLPQYPAKDFGIIHLNAPFLPMIIVFFRLVNIPYQMGKIIIDNYPLGNYNEVMEHKRG